MKFVLRYYPSPWIQFHWRWWLHWFNCRSLSRFVANCTIKREYLRLRLTLDGAWCIMAPAFRWGVERRPVTSVRPQRWRFGDSWSPNDPS